MADERARSQLHRFHAMWLGYRGIPHTADLVQAFDLETTSLIDRIVFDEPQSYLELFRSTQSYMTTFLAEHYGLPAPAAGEGWVDYGSSGRAGILSHGSVLSAFSKFSDTSPTQRGIFIQTRLLCNVIPPPPATSTSISRRARAVTRFASTTATLHTAIRRRPARAATTRSIRSASASRTTTSLGAFASPTTATQSA